MRTPGQGIRAEVLMTFKVTHNEMLVDRREGEAEWEVKRTIRYPRSSRRGNAGFVRPDTLRDDHHLYGFLTLELSSNKADCPLGFFKGKAMGHHLLDGISPRFRQGDGWNH